MLDELVGGTVDFVAEKVVGSVIGNESEDSNKLVGGFSTERSPTEREQRILTSLAVKEKLEQMSNAGFSDVQVISVKSQVVAGTNYSVKYKTTDNSGVETFLLAKIFVPLPYANEPPEVMTTLYGVGEDSPLDMILKVL